MDAHAGGRPSSSDSSDKWFWLTIALMITVGCLRVVSASHHFWQTWDEPFHIAAGMEVLSKGTYTYERLHPPLARIAVAAGLFLKGKRSLENQASGWDEGFELLHGDGFYEANLALARLGILPFFIAGCLVVALWGKQCGGKTTAITATLFASTLPPLLGHAGVATLDMAASCCTAAALFSFSLWLKRPRLGVSVLVGLTIGLAVLSKFSSLGLLLFAAPLMAVPSAVRLFLSVRAAQPDGRRLIQHAGPIVFQVLACITTVSLVLWAGFRFSTGTLCLFGEAPPGLPDAVAALNNRGHLPFLEKALCIPFPATELIEGLKAFLSRSSRGHLVYFLGNISKSGWPLFYPVMLLVKTPIPFLIATALGIFFIIREAARSSLGYRGLEPILAALGCVMAAMQSSVNHGTRNILVVYFLLAIVAGYGITGLLKARYPARALNAITAGIAAVLLTLQLTTSVLAHPDYLSYFNEFAGRHPEQITTESDLDWGQDLKRLLSTIKRRGIHNLAIRYFGSYGIKLNALGFPTTRSLNPYEKTEGWIAISANELSLGTRTPPYDQFRWLDHYVPVEKVGRSIFLYYIPPSQGAAPQLHHTPQTHP